MMEFETVRKAVELMGDDPFKVQFAGGEPLLNQAVLIKTLEYLKETKPGTQCSIQTNATLLDDDNTELLKRHRVAVGVSLDGRPETNENLRGRTQEAVRGIFTLKKHGVWANLNAVVCSENAGKLSELADMAAYFGNIHGIGLDLLRNAGRAKENAVSKASAEELARGLDGLKKRLDILNKVMPHRVIVREFEKAKVMLKSENRCRDYCYAAQGNSYVVLPDGECYPCGSLAGDKKYYMGNVHTTVKAIGIPGERRQECASCSYEKACTGGCPSRGLLDGGFDELDCVLKKISFQFAQAENKEEYK